MATNSYNDLETDLKKVRKNGSKLEFIQNQTREMCLAAVQQNGIYLRHVKNKTDEIALAAVSTHGIAIVHVKNITPEIALAAVSQYGLALSLIENQTHEICIAAVSQNGDALNHVKNKTPEIILAAVSQNGLSIQYADNISPSIVLAALNKSGNDILNIVSREGLTDAIDILILNHVPVDHVSTTFSLTPFQMATRNCQVSAMQALRDHGANISSNLPHKHGGVYAELINCYYEKDLNKIIPTIAALLSMGLSPTDPDSNGEIPIELAKNKPEISSVFNSFIIKKLVESTIDQPKEPYRNKNKNTL
jgi:hypothetical protein